MRENNKLSWLLSTAMSGERETAIVKILYRLIMSIGISPTLNSIINVIF